MFSLNVLFKRENFFSLFGLFIQMTDDLLDLKNDIKQKNYTYLVKIIFSKSLTNIDFYVIKILNLIKIMQNYLEKSTSIIKKNKNITLDRFKLFSMNILSYGGLKNQDLLSKDLVDYFKKIYILKTNDIKEIKLDLILALKQTIKEL